MFRVRKIAVLFLVFGLVAAPTAAFAEEGEGEGDSTDLEQELMFWFEDAYNLLFFGYFAPDDLEEGFDCTATEPEEGEGDTTDTSEATTTTTTTTLAAEGEGDGTEEEAPTAAEGCTPVDVSGPNGQVNHGTVVSSLVHALKESFEKASGPFGQAIRKVAHSDWGKGGAKVGDDDGDGEGDEFEFESESESKKPKPNKGKGKGHNK